MNKRKGLMLDTAALDAVSSAGRSLGYEGMYAAADAPTRWVIRESTESVVSAGQGVFEWVFCDATFDATHDA